MYLSSKTIRNQVSHVSMATECWLLLLMMISMFVASCQGGESMPMSTVDLYSALIAKPLNDDDDDDDKIV